MIAMASAQRDIRDRIKFLRDRKKIQNKIKYLEYLSRQARQKIISELRGLTYNPKRLDKFARIHEENKRFGRNYDIPRRKIPSTGSGTARPVRPFKSALSHILAASKRREELKKLRHKAVISALERRQQLPDLSRLNLRR